ncbi:unnamed protein product [Malus baccata var. baccata]
MNEELKALNDNHTWSVVKLPQGKKAVRRDNVDELNALKQSLHHKFAIKDLGVLKYFLGIEIATSIKGLFLNQKKYVLDLLDEAKMMDSKPAYTLLVSKLKLAVEGEPLTNLRTYQRLAGKLIYLTITSMGDTDADWVGDALDRKSTTGFCTFVGGNLVTWKNKKQAVIARSSAEDEYRAKASTACELIWLKSLLSSLGFSSTQPMYLHYDNQVVMHMASNSVFHKRTKHNEVDCIYIRAQIQAKVIEIVFTRSHDQLADIFTKTLDSTQFQRLLCKLGISINPFDPS